jgi:hypothetical protein
LLFDAVPALILGAFASTIGLSRWCLNHHAPVCEDLTRFLTQPPMAAIAMGWLVLAFAAGMTTATVVRRAFVPAGVKAPSGVLILAGVVAVPAVGYVFFAMPGGSSGWGPLVAVIFAAFSSVVIAAWLAGYFVGRLAFAHADPAAKETESSRLGVDGVVLLILLHALFAVAAFVAMQDFAEASRNRLVARWAGNEFMLVTFMAGFPWNYGLLLALPGSGMEFQRAGGGWFMWLGVAVNYALLAWISLRAFRSRGSRSPIVGAPAHLRSPAVMRVLKVLALDVGPALVGALCFAAIVSTQACARGEYEICEQYLDRWLKVRSEGMKVFLWLLVAFSAGMVTATIGRRWYKPAWPRLPDRYLKWIGLVLVVFMGVASLGVPMSSGPIPTFAITTMLLVALLLGAWRLGLAANRRAFRTSRPRQASRG